MLFQKLSQVALLAAAAVQTVGLAIGGRPDLMIKPYKREPLQDIVTWDEVSLRNRGHLPRLTFQAFTVRPRRASSLVFGRISPVSPSSPITMARCLSEDPCVGVQRCVCILGLGIAGGQERELFR